MKNIYWLTGLPCSGKSSIARELSRHIYAEILDGDNIRSLTGNYDFSNELRAMHMMYVAAMAHYISKHQNVIVSLISPIRSIRDAIREKYANLYEIYVKCDLDVCRRRDTKGMYAKAARGEITNFTGVQEEYEEPLNPHMIVRSDKNSIDECVSQILALHENKPKALIIGRWQPLHEGHRWLVEEVQQMGHEVLLGIRQTPLNKDNPYSVNDRIHMIQQMFKNNVDYVVLPDIVGVYYERNVGYEVRELQPPPQVAAISATNIRQRK